MALTDFKIVESDYTGRDISGLPNRPALPAPTLKARFDALVKNVVKVKFNGFIDAVVTAVSGLVSKVSGGTAGNFASLTADGSIADSGKKAADFEAAGAVAAHNTAASPHTGKFAAAAHPHGNITADGKIASTANLPVFTGTAGLLETKTNKDAMRYISSAVSGVYSAAGNNYTKIGTVLCNTYEHASGIIMIQDANAGANFGLLQVAFTGIGTSVVIDKFVWIARNGFEAYVLPSSATVKTIYIKVPEAWETPYISFLGPISGNISLDAESPRVSSLPTAPDATATDHYKLGDTADLPVFTTTDGALATKSAADARASLGITRANLGIRTYAGTITLPSGYNYVTVYMSGVTSSYHAVAMRTGSTGTFDPIIPLSTVCGSGTVTVYFSASGGSGGTSVPIYIIATL